MTEDKYPLVSKIIDFSIADNPANVKATVDQIMLDKIQSEVEAKKIEMARQMFNNAIDDPNEEDPEEEDQEANENDFFDDENEADEYEGEEDPDMETEIEITDDELEDLFNSLEDLEELESLDDVDISGSENVES